MPNLDITSGPSYTRTLNKIMVTGTADLGVTVRVMIIPVPPKPIDDQSEFNAKYDSVSNKASVTVQVEAKVAPKVTAMIEGAVPASQAPWSVQVPVTGLTAGTQYSLYASNGVGKIEPQSPVTFS